jgi:hypothetical protein
MKFRAILLLSFVLSFIFTSCRKEETEFVQAPEEETLVANSNIALLIQRTVSNDGSEDNIVDRANCFDIVFPYEVNANNQLLTLSSHDDLANVECVFDQSDDDTDTLDIIFPITIMLEDFSEVTITNLSEFDSHANICNGENVIDDDIECVDFQYPIEGSIFNSNNELLDIINISSDKQLYNFIEDIDENDIITVEFPITVILSDNSEMSIDNFYELQSAIENNINACDEDDHYNYNVDDCDDCTIIEVEDLLTGCTDWMVNTLRRDSGTNYDNEYYNYAFNFFTDGTMSVFWNTTTVYGTWIADGSGNAIEIIIDIPALPLCNNNWILREIKNCTDETEIDLRVGVDRIQYIRNCN